MVTANAAPLVRRGNVDHFCRRCRLHRLRHRGIGSRLHRYLRPRPDVGLSALQPVTVFGAMFSAFATTAGLAQPTRGKAHRRLGRPEADP